jgi:hypothetical protein
MSNAIKRAAAGAVMGGSLLLTGGFGLANAQPVNLQDGLVNVAVGNVNILNDVQVGVAANVVATVCGVPVTAAVLGSVDQTGATSQAFCSVPGGPVTVTQNGGSPGQSGQAPGGGAAQAPGNPNPGGPNR